MLYLALPCPNVRFCPTNQKKKEQITVTAIEEAAQLLFWDVMTITTHIAVKVFYSDQQQFLVHQMFQATRDFGAWRVSEPNPPWSKLRPVILKIAQV